MRTPTHEEKVEVYERVLHKLQVYGAVTLDYDRMRQLMTRIFEWSHSHRAGERTIEEQQELINKAFWSLVQNDSEK